MTEHYRRESQYRAPNKIEGRTRQAAVPACYFDNCQNLPRKYQPEENGFLILL